MSTFGLRKPSSSRIFDFFDNYNDAFIHSDDKLFKAHKLMLAIQSPYLHRLFQKVKDGNFAQIFLLNMPNSVIENVLNLIYGKNAIVQKKDISNFKGLLTKWQVDYQDINTENEEQMAQQHKDETIECEEEDKETGDGSITEKSDSITKKSFDLKDKSGDIPDDITEDASDNIKKADVHSEKGVANNPEVPEDVGGMSMTNTDTTEIYKLLGYICHELQGDKMKKEKRFKCLVCANVSVYFQQAKNHFALFHQDNKEEIKILSEAESLRSTSSVFFSNLSADMDKDDFINSVGCLMSSTVILQRMKTTLEKVEGLQKPVFPPTFQRKKNALIRDLGKFIKLGEGCIDKLENMTT